MIHGVSIQDPDPVGAPGGDLRSCPDPGLAHRRRRAGRRCQALLVGVALAALSGHLAAEGRAVPDLLTLLKGAWARQAVITPIGPRPYDLDFRRTPDGHLDGAAQPGGSTHHWSFRRHGDGLVLRFLSTFAGNTDPIWLDAVDARAPEIVFQARHPAFLRVRVRPGPAETWIRIFHGERLHVEIRLTRRQPASSRTGNRPVARLGARGR
jgi:hypothetical protein